MAIRRRELIAGAMALAGMLWAGPAAFGSDRTVGRISDLAMRNKSARVFNVGGTQVLVYRRSARRFSGFVATCPSDQTNLTTANMRGIRITCPIDKSVFRVTNGRRVRGPANANLERVPMKVANGFLVATIGAVAGPAPLPGQLVESSKVPIGGGLINRTSSEGPLMIVQPRKGQFIAYSARCTHSGCEVNEATATAIICTMPCGHGSQFSTSTGKAIVGPARDPLKKFEVVERNGLLFLR
jgi:nitrite reductase/ring-hydroxylating ferredoxin subunit